MRSCCPIPFVKSIKYEKKYVFPLSFKCSGYSPMCFSLDFFNNNKKYFIKSIYHNVEFKNKAVRFCYA